MSTRNHFLFLSGASLLAMAACDLARRADVQSQVSAATLPRGEHDAIAQVSRARRSVEPTVAKASTFDATARRSDGLRAIVAPVFERDDDGELRFTISEGGENLRVRARPNLALFAADVQVIRDGESLTLAQAGLEIPLQGVVEGRAGSWVRLGRHGDGYQGLISSGKDLYDLRAEPGNPGLMRFGKVVADDTDATLAGEPYACASDGLLRHATANRQPVVVGCTSIDIMVVADHTHLAALGSVSASESEMVNRMNEVDGIYRASLNHAFRLKEIVTLPNQGDPAWNVSNPPGEQYPDTPLEGFSDWKGAKYPNRGLAHLFTARTQTGIVGLSWVGTTCLEEMGAGVTNYLGPGRVTTINVAHEIGHNFGSMHDGGNQGFIMHPSIVAQATEFSPESKSAVADKIGDCFKACDIDDSDTSSGDTTTSTSTSSSETSSSTSTSSTTTTGTTTNATTSSTTDSTATMLPTGESSTSVDATTTGSTTTGSTWTQSTAIDTELTTRSSSDVADSQSESTTATTTGPTTQPGDTVDWPDLSSSTAAMDQTLSVIEGQTRDGDGGGCRSSGAQLPCAAWLGFLAWIGGRRRWRARRRSIRRLFGVLHT